MLNVGSTYTYDYTDLNGNLTERVCRVMEDGGRYLRCFCFTRNEPRTFRKEAIVNPRETPRQVADALWNAALAMAPRPEGVTYTAVIPASWRPEAAPAASPTEWRESLSFR